MFLTTQIADDTVTRAFSLKSSQCADIYNPPLPFGGYSFFNSLNISKRGKIVNGFSAVFSKFGKITAAFYAKKVE